MEIQISDYPIYMKIGHFQSEQAFVRPVYVSLQLESVLTSPDSLEKLDKTVDYGEVLSFLEAEFTGKSLRLLEALLFEIARALLARFPLLGALTVSVEKSFMRKGLLKGSRISLKEKFKRTDF